MSTPREQADITRVTKHGDVYTVEGVHNGHHASFHVDAKSLDSMTTTKSKEFLQRSIRNLAIKE